MLCDDASERRHGCSRGPRQHSDTCHFVPSFLLICFDLWRGGRAAAVPLAFMAGTVPGPPCAGARSDAAGGPVCGGFRSLNGCSVHSFHSFHSFPDVFFVAALLRGPSPPRRKRSPSDARFSRLLRCLRRSKVEALLEAYKARRGPK